LPTWRNRYKLYQRGIRLGRNM